MILTTAGWQAGADPLDITQSGHEPEACHLFHGKAGSWPIYVNAEEVSQFEWISEPTLTR
jgi:hypothetical protein